MSHHDLTADMLTEWLDGLEDGPVATDPAGTIWGIRGGHLLPVGDGLRVAKLWLAERLSDHFSGWSREAVDALPLGTIVVTHGLATIGIEQWVRVNGGNWWESLTGTTMAKDHDDMVAHLCAPAPVADATPPMFPPTPEELITADERLTSARHRAETLESHADVVIEKCGAVRDVLADGSFGGRDYRRALDDAAAELADELEALSFAVAALTRPDPDPAPVADEPDADLCGNDGADEGPCVLTAGHETMCDNGEGVRFGFPAVECDHVWVDEPPVYCEKCGRRPAPVADPPTVADRVLNLLDAPVGGDPTWQERMSAQIARHDTAIRLLAADRTRETP